MDKNDINQIVNILKYPIDNKVWISKAKEIYENTGLLSMPNFLVYNSLKLIQSESKSKFKFAYFNPQKHNVYLQPFDSNYSSKHPRNKNVISSKGCITDDLIDLESPLRILYNSLIFKKFISFITNQESLYPYEDIYSSINIHYARKGEELGWHFDNSSFAITLMINSVSQGGEFEYTDCIRGKNIEKSQEFKNVSEVLNNKYSSKKITMKPGGMLLFNGKDSMHRVTKVNCDEVRILVVFAYNKEPGISLSKSAQKTFYGKISR